MAIELAQDGGKFSGVDTLLERMKTHPEEFFEGENAVKVSRSRWSFIYKDYFRDCLTESEKGRMLEGLRTVRRLEFDALVVRELMREEIQEKEMAAKVAVGPYITGGGTISTTNLGVIGPSAFGAVPQKERE